MRVQKSQHPAFRDEARSSFIRSREPGESALGEMDNPSIFSRLHPHVLRHEVKAGREEFLCGDVGCQRNKWHVTYYEACFGEGVSPGGRFGIGVSGADSWLQPIILHLTDPPISSKW